MTATRIRSIACLTSVLLAACSSRDAKSGGDTATTAAPAAAATANAAPSGPGCPETGQWVRCNVEKRLERSGLVATFKDTVRQSFLHVPGLRYDIGRGEVQVYLYPDSVARARDSQGLDSATASPKGGHAFYDAQPSLVLSNNMTAIVVSNNETLVERATLALGAGLPR